MVNETDQQEHVFVIPGDYYYRMVNDRKQIHTKEHQETGKLFRIITQFQFKNPLTQTSTFSGEYGRH
jgi:hypothetical protein